MAKLQLRILTADEVKVDQEVDMIIMRCVLEDMGSNHSAIGEIGVMANHMPLSGVLGINPLRIFNDEEERRMAIFGGVVTVKDNVATLLTEKALWSDEIEQGEAKAQLTEAERVLGTDETSGTNRDNLIAYRRAAVQVEVAAYQASGRR